MYELPFGSGRGDAAPRGDSSGGGSGSRSGGEGKVTSIRSENNFGSSSVVPGAEPVTRDQDGSTGNGSGQAGSTESGGTSDPAISEVPAASGSGSSPDGPSEDIIFPLLALVLATGAAVGILAARSARRVSG